ncbi:MAG: PEP/pyruvate-binding domain-containing protein [Chloroflexota bacterium]
MNPPIRPQSLRSVTPTIDIYIRLAQYPILADSIRYQMRQELFRRGIVDPDNFEREVKEKAIESQQREGLYDPFNHEHSNVWQKRLDRTRNFQTDAAFASNLSPSILDRIIEQVLQSQPGASANSELTFNPEVAPWELLFRQGEIYEALPLSEQESVKHHLEGIKIVLIKGMISDQLQYIGVAKQIFSIADLRFIYRHRIGGGKIGGKAAGMLLAWRIMMEKGEPALRENIKIPPSYFIGSEVIYDFRLKNNLDRFMNQKYLPLEEIRKQHPLVEAAHMAGDFPDKIVKRLQEVLDEVGNSPLIVRSSSLLEDNFGTSFAGKYDSFFCPNQGTVEENLQDLMDAIRKVYASTLNPNAILYRQQNGLIDYDERMAILLQRLDGKAYGRYYMPTLAGVGFSQNPFRWHKKIRREDGFLRLVVGMGTRAVDRVANDYPRMIALSHPQLRPETTAADKRKYSQWLIDAIDMKTNQFVTLQMDEMIQADFPELRFVAELDKGDYLQQVLAPGLLDDEDEFILSLDFLTKDKGFVHLMRSVLATLEAVYETAVDIEYTLSITPSYPQPTYHLSLVQCRPLSQRIEHEEVTIPKDIPQSDIVFRAKDLIPNGNISDVRYLIMIDPNIYRTIPNLTIKQELGRVVSRLNSVLKEEKFILMGPGRWGSNNLDLGVKVSYADIYNTQALVEIGIEHDGSAPELSYGTHFFQDLVEANIHSIPLHLTQEDNWLNWELIKNAPNALSQLSPADSVHEAYVQVVDLTAVSSSNSRLTILMDSKSEEALAFLKAGEWQNDENNASISTF